MEDQRPHAVGLQDALNPGEKILWAGAPPGRVLFNEKDFVAIPFAVIRVLFAAWIAWRTAAAGALGATFFVIFAAAGGLLLLPGRLLLDAIRRSTTAYALTDQRILILATFPFRNILSLPLNKTTIGALSPGEDGSATIEVTPTPGFVPRGCIPVVVVGFSLSPPLRLERIRDAQRVYDKIRAAQASAV